MRFENLKKNWCAVNKRLKNTVHNLFSHFLKKILLWFQLFFCLKFLKMVKKCPQHSHYPSLPLILLHSSYSLQKKSHKLNQKNHQKPLKRVNCARWQRAQTQRRRWNHREQTFSVKFTIEYKISIKFIYTWEYSLASSHRVPLSLFILRGIRSVQFLPWLYMQSYTLEAFELLCFDFSPRRRSRFRLRLPHRTILASNLPVTHYSAYQLSLWFRVVTRKCKYTSVGTSYHRFISDSGKTFRTIFMLNNIRSINEHLSRAFWCDYHNWKSLTFKQNVIQLHRNIEQFSEWKFSFCVISDVFFVAIRMFVE